MGVDLFSRGHQCYRRDFFEEGFGLDGKEILIVDSDLNENTSLCWIKTSSRGSTHHKRSLRRSPLVLPVKAHRRRVSHLVTKIHIMRCLTKADYVFSKQIR